MRQISKTIQDRNKDGKARGSIKHWGKCHCGRESKTPKHMLGVVLEKPLNKSTCGDRDGCELYPEDCGRPQGSYAR